MLSAQPGAVRFSAGSARFVLVGRYGNKERRDEVAALSIRNH